MTRSQEGFVNITWQLIAPGMAVVRKAAFMLDPLLTITPTC